MDWNKHQTYEHLTPMQVQQKIDELGKQTQTIPILKKDLEVDNLYTVEIWYHFKGQMQIAIIYKDLLFE